MTDITDPAAGETPPTPAEPATSSPATTSGKPPTPRPVPPGGHTRGGLPAVPLAITASNVTAGGVAATALAAGPVAAGVTAGVVTAVAGVGAFRSNRQQAKARRSKPAPTNRATAAAARSGAIVPPRRPAAAVPAPARRAGAAASSGGAGRGGGRRAAAPAIPRPTTTAGNRGRTLAGSPVAGATMTRPRPTTGPTTAAARRTTPAPVPIRATTSGGGVRQAAAAVKAARAARREAAPTRADRRRQDTAARRTLAAARRGTTGPGTPGTAGGGIGRRTGKTGPTGGGGAGGRRAGARRFPGVREVRPTRADRRGRAVEDRVQRTRDARRRAAATRHQRRRLLGSRARFAGRCLLAGAAALPVGLLGLVSTPIGRRLGVNGLMYPGRRLWRFLTRRARAAHDRRTDDITDQAPKTGLGPPIADAVPRAPKHHHSNSTGGPDMADTAAAGFNFAAAAEDMHISAATFQPDGMMEVLRAFEALPSGMHHIAETFKILAERSDSEFPLEQQVGQALSEVFALLTQAMSSSEEVAKAFRTAHEHDIARHEQPRPAENKWDTTNNQ